MFQIISPKTEQELSEYYDFRWQMLRAPLNLPQGSEKDAYDSLAEHCMIKNEDGKIVAVARMHLSNADEVQIRHTAVAKDQRGQGLGSLLMSSLEKAAHKMGIKRVILFSRESAIEFYQKCGYAVVEDTVKEEADGIHVQMRKTLEEKAHFLRHPKWCQELQERWDNEIPISHLMGIKVHQYTGHLFEARAALNANLNLHGTMFAGSVYSLATLTGWGMIYLMLKEHHLEGDIVLGEGKIHYNKPITELPRAVCHISSVKGTLKAATKTSKSKIELSIDILDDNEDVATFEGTYLVLPPKGLITEQDS